MYIRELKDKYTLILCKMSGEKMGTIYYQDITSISKGIQKISELTFTVNKYYGTNNNINPLYDELKNERFINLDDTETYVIKNIREINDTKKEVTAYSREKKLCKSKVEFEDICITLKTKDETVHNSYTLDELLYEDTGWKLGYISEKVLYNSTATIMDILGGIEGEVTNVEKLRYQESVSTNWYDYIMQDIATQFECYPIFDSYNKKVNLYDETELGENLGLLLSYDNYLKSNEKTTSTEEIVTRLTLIGNEDLTVVNCNPTGLRYIENFSYYIESQEMSLDLIEALNLYNNMTEQRTIEWNELRELKRVLNDGGTLLIEKTIEDGNEKVIIIRIIKDEDDRRETEEYLKNNNITHQEIKDVNGLTLEQKKLLVVYSTIKSLEMALDINESETYQATLSEQHQGEIDKKVMLEIEIDWLLEQIKNASIRITELNRLCKKEYATDEDGNLIFNNELLDELKEFIYQDTYTNDNLTTDTDLMKIGKRKLAEMSIPTRTWAIDSVNFVERLVDNGFRNQWQGQLGLGDMIILKGDNVEPEAIYLVGYTQNFKDKTLELELSNKKSNNDFSLSIGERLTKAKEAFDGLKANKYIFNNIKLNRLGANYDKINKDFL
jgi:hypothetical protein